MWVNIDLDTITACVSIILSTLLSEQAWPSSSAVGLGKQAGMCSLMMSSLSTERQEAYRLAMAVATTVPETKVEETKT